MVSYSAPYSGLSTCEQLRDNGQDALICLDDLSKQAKVQRQISLIQGRVPGRDAYPADVFNVHASLLERAGKTKLDLAQIILPVNIRVIGHGSITALPIIETINCDVTEYIATNLISITDGQIYTRSSLFRNGYRPAVDSAISVSRVGSNAQFKQLRRLVKAIKNELTNYRRWFESAHIADEEEETEDVQLLRLRGRSIECMYQQDQLDLSSVEETTLNLLLYNSGILAGLSTWRFNSQLLPYIRYVCCHDML